MLRQLPLDDVGGDIGRHGDDDQRRVVVVARTPARAVVDREAQLRRRRVVERDVDAAGGERVPDARAEESGADDAHRALHARSERTRGTRRRARRFAHSCLLVDPSAAMRVALASVAERVAGRRPLFGRAARECQQSAAFHLSQLTCPPHWEGSQVQRPELPPHELDDRVADGGHHAPDDAVAAGVEGQLDERLRRPSVASVDEQPGLVGGDRAVLELDPARRASRWSARSHAPPPWRRRPS